jgi:hypothetical protein
VKCLKFPIYNATRWFSRWQCVSTLSNNYSVLVMFLQSHKKGWAAAETLNTRLRDVNVAASVACWADILAVMNEFSEALQSDDLLVHDLQAKVDDVDAKLSRFATLQAGIMRSNPTFLSRYSQFCDELSTAPTPSTSNAHDVGSVWCTRTPSNRQARVELLGVLQKGLILQFVVAACTGLLECVKARFPSTPLHQAFRLLDPAYWQYIPPSSALSKEAKDMVNTLLNHFNTATKPRKLFPDLSPNE